MRFLHAADIHLGNQQYNHSARYNDFFRAFQQVAKTAIEQKVDVCLIAGDLFHKSAVDPLTLMQAERCLNDMIAAGIRVLAVAGNHDRQRYQDDRSWLHYLHWNDKLTLLEPTHSEGVSYLAAGSSYVDVGGVRFIGVPWYGAATTTMMERVIEELPQLDRNGIHYTVLITHAGIEGEIPEVAGCLRVSDLLPLQIHIDYIATGHLHKPFIKDNWIHNPGAIENCDFNEEYFRKDGKGVFIVDIDDVGSATIRKERIPGRPFQTVLFSADTYLTPRELTSALREHLKTEHEQWMPSQDSPVVRVIVRGNLAFDRTAINVEDVRQTLQTDIDCLLLRLEMQTSGFETGIDSGEAPTFDALERQVFEELARNDARFSKQAAAWGQFMRDAKEMALGKIPPEKIYQHLQMQIQRER